MTDAKTSATGYKRAPVEHQFKPGQSGNPSGRRKGSKSMHDIMMTEMNKKVWITEHGKRKQVSKSELTWTQLMNQAASGDTKSAKLALDYYNQGLAIEDAKHAGVPVSLADRKANDAKLVEGFRAALLSSPLKVAEAAND